MKVIKDGTSIGSCGGCLCFSCYYRNGNDFENHCSGGCSKEQKCGSGIMHLVKKCDRYEEYTGHKANLCFGCWVTHDQKGILACPLVDSMGCVECMEVWNRQNGFKEE